MIATYKTHTLNLCAIQDTGDHSKQRTVTNDIENVLRALMATGELKTGHPYQRVIYRDSDGRWDIVEIDSACNFVRFAPISEAHSDKPIPSDIDPRLLFAMLLLDEVNKDKDLEQSSFVSRKT